MQQEAQLPPPLGRPEVTLTTRLDKHLGDEGYLTMFRNPVIKHGARGVNLNECLLRSLPMTWKSEHLMKIEIEAERAELRALIASHKLELSDCWDDPIVQRRVGLMLASIAELDQKRLNS
jgi:hypothetical protein